MAPAAAIETQFSSATPRVTQRTSKQAQHPGQLDPAGARYATIHRTGVEIKQAQRRSAYVRNAPLTVNFVNIIADASCTRVDGDPSSVTSGATTADDSIKTLFPSASPRVKPEVPNDRPVTGPQRYTPQGQPSEWNQTRPAQTSNNAARAPRHSSHTVVQCQHDTKCRRRCLMHDRRRRPKQRGERCEGASSRDRDTVLTCDAPRHSKNMNGSCTIT